MSILCNANNAGINLRPGGTRDFLRNVSGATLMAWLRMINLEADGTFAVVLRFSVASSIVSVRAVLGIESPAPEVFISARAQDGDATSTIVTTTSPIILGQWQHVVGVFDFATAVGKILVNGEMVVQAPFTNMTPGNTSDTAPLSAVMASDQNFNAREIDAYIEDARVYGRVLNEDEISSIYASKGKDGIVDQLQARYPLNELPPGTTVSDVRDISDNGFSGASAGAGAILWDENYLVPIRPAPVALVRR